MAPGNEPLGTLGWVASAVGGELLDGSGKETVTGVSTDSRSVERGQLFVALQGPRFDGHSFIDQVVSRGATAVVASRLPATRRCAVVRVEDTLAALHQLAGAHRDRMTVRVVAITGTNGKTTTKELTALVLGSRFRVLKTEGNYNNHIGLPLTVLRLRSCHEVAVLEMGMSGLGEIALLCRIARPSVGVLTNIGSAHTLQLGSLENIARAKAELPEGLARGGILVANADDPLVRAIAERTTRSVLTYAMQGPADMVAEDVVAESAGRMVFRVEGTTVHLPLWGRHNVYNALAGLLVGRVMEIPLGKAAAALSRARSVPGRMEIRVVRGVTVFDDSYNANPDSVETALASLGMADVSGKRILVLGEMLELGAYSEEGHKRVGRACRGIVDIVVGIGTGIEPALEHAECSGVTVYRAQDHARGAELLEALLQPGDAVLFKGSRATAVERVLAEWENATHAEHGA